MSTHSERVLGAILNKENPRRDFMGVAVLRLGEEHFPQEIHRNIFKFLVKYYDRTGDVMPQEVFVSAMESRDVEPAKVLAYSKAYEALSTLKFGEADFKWSLDELRSNEAKRQTGVAYTEAMEILERGYEDDKGVYRKGHEESRAYLTSRLHEIDLAGTSEDMPEGNVFSDYADILKDYEDRKAGLVGQGILTGVTAIDSNTGGYQRGELIMVCAYSGIGKSQVSTQTAWDCAVKQKKNVFFATSETLRPQVIRRLLARHSRLPQFEHPIDSSHIKKGILTPQDEKIFREVVDDWHNNQDYGILNVVQVPAHSTLSYVESRMRDMARDCEVDLCIIDYLALLSPEQKMNGEREAFNAIIRGAKALAQGSFDGKGVPVVSPWQLKRESYMASLNGGFYTLGALSDTSEAEKSADQIIALLREEQENREMRLQFLKMRDDDIPPITQVAIDFRNSYIGSNLGPQSLSAGSTNAFDLMANIL